VNRRLRRYVTALYPVATPCGIEIRFQKKKLVFKLTPLVGLSKSIVVGIATGVEVLNLVCLMWIIGKRTRIYRYIPSYENVEIPYLNTPVHMAYGPVNASDAPT
jgi:hypothetical protein